MTAWSIWTQINQVRLHQPSCSVDQIAWVSNERYDEFIAIQPPLFPLPFKPHGQWRPPLAYLYKINFDDAVFQVQNKSGIGVIIRDNQSMVITSLS